MSTMAREIPEGVLQIAIESTLPGILWKIGAVRSRPCRDDGWPSLVSAKRRPQIRFPRRSGNLRSETPTAGVIDGQRAEINTSVERDETFRLASLMRGAQILEIERRESLHGFMQCRTHHRVGMNPLEQTVTVATRDEFLK